MKQELFLIVEATSLDSQDTLRRSQKSDQLKQDLSKAYKIFL